MVVPFAQCLQDRIRDTILLAHRLVLFLDFGRELVLDLHQPVVEPAPSVLFQKHIKLLELIGCPAVIYLLTLVLLQLLLRLLICELLSRYVGRVLELELLNGYFEEL